LLIAADICLIETDQYSIILLAASIS
jgi:hypothetical protein